MQSRSMIKIRHDTRNTGHDCRQTDHTVQHCDLNTHQRQYDEVFLRLTICGNSVGVILFPINPPINPPMAATPANWVSTSGENPTAPSDARIPELTPNIPNALPCLAVAWDPSAEREPSEIVERKMKE